MIHQVFKLILATSAISLGSAAFDWTYANYSLWHSENAYCSPSTYLTRTNKGVLSGFVGTYHINDPSHDTEGYIGYNSAQSTIYVSFRGSETIQNWIDNLDVILTNYPLCASCEVHKGFYDAEQDSIANVISQVKSLKSKFPTYSVVVTGHSLGAALATLTALDLIYNGVTNVRMFNFGSPRIGNDQFAAFASTKLSDRSRITHHKDMVVHSPMHERFTHISNEFYQETDAVAVKTCVGYEDSSCSYQWHLTNIDDHLNYLGVVMGEGGCSAIL
jgi:hypothetical protein